MKSQINDEPEGSPKTSQSRTGKPKQSSANTLSPLVIEEYKEKWSYRRHIEDNDLKVLQWYFAVVAASLAFLFNNSDFLIAGLQKQGSIPLLMFLVSYSFFISLYLFYRKQNYNLYANRLIDFERFYCEFPEWSPSRTVFKVSILRLIFVNLLCAGCIYLLANALLLTELLSGCRSFIYLFTNVLLSTDLLSVLCSLFYFAIATALLLDGGITESCGLA